MNLKNYDKNRNIDKIYMTDVMTKEYCQRNIQNILNKKFQLVRIIFYNIRF